jgi:hypothetical protein
MSVFAVECPETLFFVKASSWINAFVQAGKYRTRKYGAEVTDSRHIHIEEVRQYVTMYGDLLDFDKNTYTTRQGEEYSLSSNHVEYDDGYRCIPMMIYKGKQYPQSLAMSIE